MIWMECRTEEEKCEDETSTKCSTREVCGCSVSKK